MSISKTMATSCSRVSFMQLQKVAFGEIAEDSTMPDGNNIEEEAKNARISAVENRDALVVKSLKSFLELRDGHSEALSQIVEIVNESFPDYSAAAVHNCLVAAFPDLQAQQGNNKEEIYYLGLSFIASQTTEEKMINWIRHRFREDEFGSVSCRTVSDIANTEVSFVRNTVIGIYVKKAFPNVYTRRSDRLRWYCGITLPEKELTVEEKKRKMWLDSACKWLRQNMKENDHIKEKCSLVFAALVQFIRKVSVDKCMAAVKCVFPNVQRKTVDRQAYYIGIGFIEAVVRDSIKYTPPKSRGMALPQPILNEEEKGIVSWLHKVIRKNERGREKLLDLSNMLRKKLGVDDMSEKKCLKYIRKGFPDITYRKRDGIGVLSGIEIKSSYKPRDLWIEKSVCWLKQIIIPTDLDYCEKFTPILKVMKEGISTQQLKCCIIFRLAFPRAIVKKTLEGKVVYGVILNENYKCVPLPVFDETDYIGDFSSVDMELGEEDDVEATVVLSPTKRKSDEDDSYTKKLEQKIDKLSSVVDNMNNEIKGLRDDMAQSSRQKDALIVQLQQTLVLLAQQQFQRIVKPNTETVISNPEMFSNGNLMSRGHSLQTLTDATKHLGSG